MVLLHGLTATRRYVVMGSSALQRAGHRVVAYDARGHGESDPAPTPDAYAYEDLASDLLASRVRTSHRRYMRWLSGSRRITTSASSSL